MYKSSTVATIGRDLFASLALYDTTSTSTLFHKTIGYNRLARKIAIANLGGPVKRKINWKEKKGKEKEGKTTILSYNK